MYDILKRTYIFTSDLIKLFILVAKVTGCACKATTKNDSLQLPMIKSKRPKEKLEAVEAFPVWRGVLSPEQQEAKFIRISCSQFTDFLILLFNSR